MHRYIYILYFHLDMTLVQALLTDCKQVIFDFQGTFPRSTTWTGLGFSVFGNLESWRFGRETWKVGIKNPQNIPQPRVAFFFETAHVWNPRIIRKKLEFGTLQLKLSFRKLRFRTIYNWISRISDNQPWNNSLRFCAASVHQTSQFIIASESFIRQGW